MESNKLLKDFKGRLLNSNKRTSVIYDKFRRGSTSINLKVLEQHGLLRRGKGDKVPITLKQALDYGEFFISFIDISISDTRNYFSEINLILKKYKESLEETNLHTLYMGKFYIEGSLIPNIETDYFRCPLILQSISIESISPKVFKVSLNENKIINNPIFNLMSASNRKPYEFKDLEEEKLEDYQSLKLYLKNLLLNAGYGIKNTELYEKAFSNEYSTYESLSSKKEEALRFFNENSDHETYVNALNICSMGIYNIASSTILSAYNIIEERNDGFIDTLFSNSTDTIGIDILEPKETEIKTISILDNSQKSAVLNSLKESSYIFGPPGTGKSQTIVNIIANIIYKHKTACFVTEKRVASDVVFQKLTQLNHFVLMVHNNQKKIDIYNKVANFMKIFEDYKNDRDAIKSKLEEYKFDKVSKDMENIFSKLSDYKIIMKTEEGKLYQKFSKLVKDSNLETITLSTDLYQHIEAMSELLFHKQDLVIVFKELIKLFNLKYLDNKHIDLMFDNSNYLDILLFNIIILNKPMKFKLGLFKRKKFMAFTDSKLFVTIKDIIRNLIQRHKIDDIFKINYLFKFLFKNGIDIENITKDILMSSWCQKFYLDNKNKIDFISTNWASDLKKLQNLKVKQDINHIYFNHLEYVYSFISDETKTFQNSKGELITFNYAYKELIKHMNRVKKSISTKSLFGVHRKLLRLFFPIFIGSPETISDHKMLLLSKDSFNYAIFDEASQIFTEKCIPTLYRANKYIIAGDEKQLGPSNWFSISNERIYELEEEVEELSMSSSKIDFDSVLEYESLIDLAKAKFRENKLLFHYRSNHKELISFSNSRYYDNQLIIGDYNSEIMKPFDVVEVDGIRENNIVKKEAEKTIEYLIKYIQSPRYSTKTFGIITSNAHQQKYIADLLDKEASKDVDLYNRLNLLPPSERIFIKNIENVQGDERDIIILALGFAPDFTGNYRQLYGPLSIKGGERRLNVAITRSKEKMIIIKSIKSDIIRSEKTGVIDLKDFLKYVELLDQPIVDEQAVNSLLNKEVLNNEMISSMIQNTSFDSEFESEVYDEVKKLLPTSDFSLLTQVPASGFKIDLAIFDKVNNKFVLAIECDGYTYHSKAFDRQRDYERQIYLESRGWRFERILSTHWWCNNVDMKKRFLNTIKTHIDTYIEIGDY
ncbi:AAA domain-containing protein [Spiroplasma apis]|uniref:Uncharacterized protein n=1 Tax=Spiroplasma apis B31 TaxID=1276258 RepID=V5RKI3_SPIAP|nr:AAA domain-containing protein [Spiroplasma apis]AHB36320.1 hypothetical protein SAPIS_v1c04750 [Spiroplasma apis B31]